MTMTITPQDIPAVLLIQPDQFKDERGTFSELWRHKSYLNAGIGPFVQDNASTSRLNALRGLHFQEPFGQGKLVMVLEGRVTDVAVDIRRGSPWFGQHVAVELSAREMNQLWVPSGFAHGFLVTSDTATVVYKCTEYYNADCDRSIRWNDPDLRIPWQIEEPLLSPKDAKAPFLGAIDVLPEYRTLE